MSVKIVYCGSRLKCIQWLISLKHDTYYAWKRENAFRILVGISEDMTLFRTGV
jgi:hypothetical protein